MKVSIISNASAILVAALLAGASTAPVFASGCPGKMAEIDQRLATGPMLDAEVLEEVVSLRAEGDAMHRRGEHDAAMAALEEALAVLEAASAAEQQHRL